MTHRDYLQNFIYRKTCVSLNKTNKMLFTATQYNLSFFKAESEVSVERPGATRSSFEAQCSWTSVPETTVCTRTASAPKKSERGEQGVVSRAGGARDAAHGPAPERAGPPRRRPQQPGAHMRPLPYTAAPPPLLRTEDEQLPRRPHPNLLSDKSATPRQPE